MGMSASASFQSVRKSLYLASAPEYVHFASKEELQAAAAPMAIGFARARAAQQQEENERTVVADRYLSRATTTIHGCTLAVLSQR